MFSSLPTEYTYTSYGRIFELLQIAKSCVRRLAA